MENLLHYIIYNVAVFRIVIYYMVDQDYLAEPHIWRTTYAAIVENLKFR